MHSRSRGAIPRTDRARNHVARQWFQLNRPKARDDVAMTEKLLCAERFANRRRQEKNARRAVSVEDAILSKDNEKDLADVPEEVRGN